MEIPSYLFTSPRGRATLSLEGNKRVYGERRATPRALSPAASCVYLYLSGPGRTLLLRQLGAKSQQDLPIKAQKDAVGIRKSIQLRSSLDKQTRAAANLFTIAEHRVFNFSANEHAVCVSIKSQFLIVADSSSARLLLMLSCIRSLVKITTTMAFLPVNCSRSFGWINTGIEQQSFDWDFSALSENERLALQKVLESCC